MSRPVNAMTYALLGLLSVRSWTGYELTQQVQHSLSHVWPASAANLYREQQRLVRLGWADVTAEPAGPQRTRNRYTITADGRAALRAWLDQPPGATNLESEALLRVWFADAGTPEQLTRTLRTAADEARAAVDRVVEVFAHYLDDTGAFPERAHLNAMVGELLADLFGLLDERCTALAAEVEDWKSTTRIGVDDATRARMERVVRTYGR
ncbi:PadR family transcriptional regulator [Sporichthya polymorpha]|uniref:PadR family transcriptional regulator n=1 Tax=Sporichthya polymorpha TaxID=35751 RepID=UPI00036AAA40|nr:PadR family transcriptional regulator [Sporichthya polymorpha]